MIFVNSFQHTGAAEDNGPYASDTVPLWLESSARTSTCQPISFGLPFPKGWLTDPRDVALTDSAGRDYLIQTTTQATWPDGSVKWLLVDFVTGPLPSGRSRWELRRSAVPDFDSIPSWRSKTVRVRQEQEMVVVDTGHAQFHLKEGAFPLPQQVRIAGQEGLIPGSAQATLTDHKGRVLLPRVERTVVESRGPVRVTFRSEGSFGGRNQCRFVARTSFFANTALTRVCLTVHNPKRAVHSGGLWDLGDRGSILFRDLSLNLSLGGTVDPEVLWTPEHGTTASNIASESLVIDQLGSGGVNWQSPNHVNRNGRQPCPFQGYRVQEGARETYGLRASPVVLLKGDNRALAVAVPEFWQQFPKALRVNGRMVSVGLFPESFDDTYELQGGEQKTHTIWFDFAVRQEPTSLPLDWVHQSAFARATPEWYGDSATLPEFGPWAVESNARLAAVVESSVDPEQGLAARREIIDEYGWRNYGDLYADHEGAYYNGPTPVISHYNNQYDVVYGSILQYLRTGDTRWVEIFGPLARHVIDIDIYHTKKDRSAYNGGMFWHTDHYKDASTSTHRSYSRSNAPPDRRPYGGGPCNEHNYSTGLWYYHLLTGDPTARRAVIKLGDWILSMDDGSKTIFRLLDSGPTGLASCTLTPEYQGPGRGCGNSINSLINAWEASGKRIYLDYAEVLIQRTVHPAMDIASLELLDAERRWSYTVLLSALVRYLAVKAELGETDASHAYARASLLAFAEWMLEHEVPYLDRPDELEYPTETWAAQELRKANVLRFSAAHADEPLRSALLRRGEELSERAWCDLDRFDSRYVTRSLAILLVEGTRDAYLRAGSLRSALRPSGEIDFGALEGFIPQKRRVLNRLRAQGAALHALLAWVGFRPKRFVKSFTRHGPMGQATIRG